MGGEPRGHRFPADCSVSVTAAERVSESARARGAVSELLPADRLSAGSDFETYSRVRDTWDRSATSAADFGTSAADFGTNPSPSLDSARPASGSGLTPTWTDQRQERLTSPRHERTGSMTRDGESARATSAASCLPHVGLRTALQVAPASATTSHQVSALWQSRASER